MKDLKIIIVLLAVTAVTVVNSAAVEESVAVAVASSVSEQNDSERGGRGRGGRGGDDDSERREDDYDCAIEFDNYNLDNEPAENGLVAGDYSPGKKAYVGLGVWRGITLIAGRIQLSPAGLLVPGITGPGTLTTDRTQIWYLKKQRDQEFKWVPSQNAIAEPFAVEFGKAGSGIASYVGRIRRNNVTLLGNVVEDLGVMFYVDENGQTKQATSGYEVLTCRTDCRQTPIPPPTFVSPAAAPNVDTGCINNWVAYNNDDAPVTKGIAAGSFDCGNIAYVGKGSPSGVAQPARIQVVGKAGAYYALKRQEVYRNSSSFYLADNPNYTYYWVPFNAAADPLPNSVRVRNPVGPLALVIARVTVNGQTKIGYVTNPVGTFINAAGNDDEYHSNFEVLVCDPVPKYKCSQSWKSFSTGNATVDGFSIDSKFIGRTIRKCIRGCGFGLGSATLTGVVTYLDEFTAAGVTDSSSNTEYLVRNANDNYQWVASVDGVKVKNAIEVSREGHRPFYIGSTSFNEQTVIGKVRPGEGLFFVNPETGKLTVTNSYTVLTCTSPNVANGLDH